MMISEAAKLSALTAKTIRYYEDEGLLKPSRHPGNGYREYSDRDVHVLRFLSRARSLGFSLDDCRQLLALYEDCGRSSADVKRLALARMSQIDEKIGALTQMRATLSALANSCQGDNRPDCPILEGLAAEAAAKD